MSLIRKLYPAVFALSLFLAAPPHSNAQVSRVVTLADSLAGAVGGMVVDRLGTVYSADFRNSVWKITADGEVSLYASGFYGTSGMAIDRQGRIYQASFNGNYVSRIERSGQHQIIATEGLNGPVGVAVSQEGDLFVNNCSANSISHFNAEGHSRVFAESDLFNCPNGLYLHTDGHLYVVNFSDSKMLSVDESGNVSEFALIPGGGNGHVSFARGAFYVTAFQTHRIYRVSLEGEVTLAAGTGAIGELDGPAGESTFTFPNGIAAGPLGDRLYVNDFINRSPPNLDIPPAPLSNVRMIKLASISELMVAALRSGGVGAMEESYRAFKTDPATSGLFTEIEVNALGYGLMQNGQLPAATRVFELNVESYPNSFNVYDSLGEAYKNAGRDADAIANYEKSLEINAANQNAVDMLEEIRAK